MKSIQSIIFYFILGFAVSIIFALMEIQIEGKDGWAGKLPTWRVDLKFFKFFNGDNKPLTGYHLYLWILLFLIPHTAFIFTSWSVGRELAVVSFYMLFLRVEDFFWFVFNPNYGIKKFKKGSIPWHREWLGPLPLQYYPSILLWGVVFWLSLIIS